MHTGIRTYETGRGTDVHNGKIKGLILCCPKYESLLRTKWVLEHLAIHKNADRFSLWKAMDKFES